ncbi:tripartite tricarboxylate transporter substrate binding protein [Ramlibacter sp. MAH-25]|uniref:Tripartite tricarboxylate transporter substrate binding protein n=1 Tax=Ramlibacter pinisoli TaxID=2682844 RepID=A0A6N8IX21_9BURK|nr:tripartite tricarboxylate transporter substrate binding protein [Ramlibacter sp. CGMCC 1.13660]MVQ31318.1 tripartite tricarboxylate transporter substrate binding protein [Ramlibacter pinisoli]
MRCSRRSLLRLGAAACAAAAFPLTAGAQSGTGKVIVPYAPGAATDTLGRLMADLLGTATGTRYIVDNRGGGATQIGTKAVATAAPDGLTLGFIDTAFVINPGLFGSALPYDTRQDFAPVSLMATAPLVLVVHPSVAAKTVAELVALAKAQPGKLVYGSAGAGSAPHLAGEQLRQAAGIDIIHAPYRGGATVLNDLLAGHIQFGFTTVPTMLQHIRAGSVRALAVTSATRAGQLPQVPTMKEAGLPAVDASPLFGLVAPAKTPQPVLEKLAAAAQAARSGTAQARLSELGFTPVGSSPEEFRARIEAEIAKWTAVIRAGNIKPGE